MAASVGKLIFNDNARDHMQNLLQLRDYNLKNKRIVQQANGSKHCTFCNRRDIEQLN